MWIPTVLVSEWFQWIVFHRIIICTFDERLIAHLNYHLLAILFGEPFATAFLGKHFNCHAHKHTFTLIVKHIQWAMNTCTRRQVHTHSYTYKHMNQIYHILFYLTLCTVRTNTIEPKQKKIPNWILLVHGKFDYYYFCEQNLNCYEATHSQKYLFRIASHRGQNG